MPYKARLKQGEARKRKKTEYRVTNARAYNLSLKKRGMISLYFPSGEAVSMISTGFMMLCFYTTRANFAILPHPNKAPLSRRRP
ncbi:hypothetical protein [Enterobacter hormaechei]|uniref:hypothetical protein n=1 Tax=Enterobacter hormaechei TaxID=158836 RepID=UPI000B9FDAD9|nr:hypothetical protein [Enterobacter hormaechei]EIQ7173220.1 hypothetical protein [Escherichia coli]MBT1725471.1 hypothetical protein [Enterobacter hormaechei subsp. hoffmannii]EIQ9904912.1 hypothetical protein [Escherichia coli]MCL8116509.1 hypothetical protein [Enterobacter hormaechei]MCM8212696.1 hypothetical protein [Enterobacter hormaechei]